MFLRSLLALCLLFASVLAVAQPNASTYNFSAPELVAQLDSELAEISGLSLTTDQPNELLAVEDENGKVYRLNASSGIVLWAVDFWKDGDYEGVEMVGDEVWVVKNTGTLYRITNIGKPDQHTEKYNGDLNGDNDVEGLAYDRAGNRLLLACKRDADDDGNSKDGRYIFTFDLSSKTFSKDPVYAIKQADIVDYLGTHPTTANYERLNRFFATDKKFDLSPSSLAIHPTTGNLYLTSSVGELLMVVSPAGQILELHYLGKKALPQPEGLAFGADGTLYICTEAQGKAPARLYRFTPEK